MKIEGYEKRTTDRYYENVYIRVSDGKMFYSTEEALKDFYKKICFYANTKHAGHSIHHTIR